MRKLFWVLLCFSVFAEYVEAQESAWNKKMDCGVGVVDVLSSSSLALFPDNRAEAGFMQLDISAVLGKKAIGETRFYHGAAFSMALPNVSGNAGTEHLSMYSLSYKNEVCRNLSDVFFVTSGCNVGAGWLADRFNYGGQSYDIDQWFVFCRFSVGVGVRVTESDAVGLNYCMHLSEVNLIGKIPQEIPFAHDIQFATGHSLSIRYTRDF